MFLYIAEVCPANQRTLYFSVCPNNVGLGMLFVSILSMYFHWRTVSAILCAMSFANVIVLFWVPESPMWLRANGRKEQADKADKWFDVTHDNSAATTPPMNCSVNSSDEIGSKPYWSLYLRPTVWKPTLITVFLFAIQQGTGVNVLLFYSMDVIHDCRIPWDATTVSMFLSGSRVVGAICFSSLHRVKRRTLLIISGGCMAASLFVVLAYMRTFRDVEHPPYATTPIIAFVVFLFFCMIGILPVPWAICGEVFPTAVSGISIHYYKHAIDNFTLKNIGIRRTDNCLNTYHTNRGSSNEGGCPAPTPRVIVGWQIFKSEDPSPTQMNSFGTPLILPP